MNFAEPKGQPEEFFRPTQHPPTTPRKPNEHMTLVRSDALGQVCPPSFLPPRCATPLARTDESAGATWHSRCWCPGVQGQVPCPVFSRAHS